MKIPHRCPICYGTGNVPRGFYLSSNVGGGTSSASPEPCRSCENGIIYVEQCASHDHTYYNGE